MLVVAREPPAGTAKTGLDFVGDEQYPGLVTDRARGSEVAVGRHDHPGLTLDRLDEERDRIRAHRGAQRVGIPVRDRHKARAERAKPGPRERIVGEADNRRRPAVEVAGAHDDLRTVRSNPLALVAPLARELDRGLDRLRPRVHRQHAVASAELRQFGAEASELIVVKGAARQRQPSQLLASGPQEPRVAVAEIEAE